MEGGHTSFSRSSHDDLTTAWEPVLRQKSHLGGNVHGLVVKAKSLESAEAFCNLLWRYHPELSRSQSDEYEVSVDLANDSHMIAALTAIHEYANARNDPAHIELESHSYTLQPT